MRDLGPSKGKRPGIANADLLEELESSRRRVRELERNLAERELREAADQKEVARLVPLLASLTPGSSVNPQKT